MIKCDRELLNDIATINSRIGHAVLELFEHQDGGELPADGLDALAEHFEAAARRCRRRAAELRNQDRTIDAEQAMLLNDQAEQAL